MKHDSLPLACVLSILLGAPGVAHADEPPWQGTVAAVPATADSFVHAGDANTNEGGSTWLRVWAPGNNRALVYVPIDGVRALLGDRGTLLRAYLRLDLVLNDRGHGDERGGDDHGHGSGPGHPDGQWVAAHRLTQSWAEGGGFVVENTGPQSMRRGSGAGTTWNCAVDTDISNHRDDCAATAWSTAWITPATALTRIGDAQLGFIYWDVTADVTAMLHGGANHGWLVKAEDENHGGRLMFSSRTGSGTAPSLVIDYQPYVNVPPALSVGTSTSIREGDRFARTANAIDPDSTAWTGSVDWGDGSSEPLVVLGDGSFVLDHVYADNGTFTITVSVTDEFGDGDVETIAVEVANVAPLVFAGDAATIPEGQSFERAASFVDPGADQWTATADWGDGSSDSLAIAGGSLALAHHYPNAGSRNVMVTVCDDDGACGSATVLVISANLDPVAAFEWSPAPQNEGSPVAFTNRSVAQPWDPLSFSWSFGGLGTSTVEHPTFTFDQDGVYPVCLTATDDEGTSHTSCSDVTILDLGPSAYFLWSPAPQDEGSPISFTDASTSSPDPIVAWSWSFGGGLSSTERDPSFTFLADDAHLVCLTVTDSDGSENTACNSILVLNVAPIADAGGPYVADEGSTIALTGTGTDPGQDIVAYEWDLDGDGAFDDASSAITSITSTRSYATPIAFRASDDDGATGVDTTTLTFLNVPPTADAGGPYLADEGDTIELSAAGSTDPGQDIVSHSWDLDGDGVFGDALGPTTSITRDDDAHFIVSVRVTDADGAFDDASAEVTFQNTAPIVTAGPPASIDARTTYSGSGTATDRGNDSLTAVADFGDGTPAQTLELDGAGAFSLGHTYMVAGFYTVTVTVTDDDGASGVASFEVAVNALAPEVDAGPDAETTEGTLFVTSGSFFDPTRSTFVVLADFGDGSAPELVPVLAGQTFTLQHVYADEGVYTLAVIVTNDTGRTGGDSRQVVVHNVAPVIALAAPATIPEGTTFRGTGSFFDPGADVWSGIIDYGDGSGAQPLALQTDRSFELAHDYAREGTYPISITIADEDGGIGAYSATLVVENVAPVVSMHDRGRYPLGRTDLTFTSVDFSGNRSSCSTAVTVVDTTAPSISCPSDQEVTADAQCTGLADPRATATDVCNPRPEVSRAPAGNVWPLGASTLVHTALDNHGNSSQCTSRVVVVDRTAPAIACNAFDIRSDQSASFTATAQDACGASLAIISRDCWAPGPGGTRIDKRGICNVTFGAATVTITTPGDPGDHVEWTAVATDAGGNSTTMVCGIVVQPPLVSVSGCADGQREGFRNLTTHPNIAGCSGGWTIPGIHPLNPGIAPACGVATFNTTTPACNRVAGDDSTNPLGTGCNVADLCGVGWHVCNTGNDVAAKSATGCVGATVTGDPSLFFATRQSTTGCGVCANGAGTGPSCNSGSCAGGCLQTAGVSNDFFGCGNMGSLGFACGPLDRFSHDQCSGLGSPWVCSAGGGFCEAYTVRKTAVTAGGVLCCRD